MKNITKDQFVAILRDAGITEDQMKALHQHFEKRHPEQHQSFLMMLGVAPETIREIRKASAG